MTFLRSFLTKDRKHTKHYNSDSASLVKLSSLDAGYIPWTSSSMRPEAIVHILNEIIINQKRQILELGMGVTTVFISSLIQKGHNAQFISVEHDIEWLELSKKQLLSKGLLSATHTFVHAPLVDSHFQAGRSTWYDIGVLRAVPRLKPDLLIIDGPPAWKTDLENSRVPAYEALSNMLSHDATVFIDDYLRPGEALLLTLFESNPEWTVVARDDVANVAVIRRSGARQYNTF